MSPRKHKYVRNTVAGVVPLNFTCQMEIKETQKKLQDFYFLQGFLLPQLSKKYFNSPATCALAAHLNELHGSTHISLHF
jgi:hypothetical protein